MTTGGEPFACNLAEAAAWLGEAGVCSRGVGSDGVGFTDIVADSRLVTPGALFVALQGTKSDGAAYLTDAKARGAVAALVAEGVELQGFPGLVVANVREALAHLAALRWGDPSKKLRVAAVTGTNGKSTIAWIVHSLLTQSGRSSLLVGTIGVFRGTHKLQESALTTPDALTLQWLMASHLADGGTDVVMEASSHALDQHRLDGVAFDAVAFSNLTRDHADYHPNFEHYYASKRRLFELAQKSLKVSQGVIAVDEPFGRRMFTDCDGTVPLVAVHRAEESSPGSKDIKYTCEVTYNLVGEGNLGVLVDGEAFQFATPLVGDFNATNLVQALALCRCVGVSFAELMAWVPTIPQVPGRLELFTGDGVSVLVDYAHTPDALERVLSVVRRQVQRRLWVVFGCGGDRDPGKRPLMGEVAQRLADEVVVTSDNPRTEDPDVIVADIVGGIATPVVVEADRARAIAYAVAHAEAGDVVVIAGKGHEDYQIVGKEKLYFSDQEQVRQALARRKLRESHQEKGIR